MTPLILNMIQVVLASGLLYGYYHLALRNNRFHQYNRFYLLAATVISLCVPFLNIPVYFTAAEKESSIVYSTLSVLSGRDEAVSVYAIQTGPEKISWFTPEHIWLLIYCSIALLVLFRIIFSLLKIHRIIRQNQAETIGNIQFINTDEPGTPFSFFRWLFWNRKISLQSEKGEQIFRHELFHIEHKHSIDILYLEILTVIGWVNPFFHLIKKETKAIHEFLADQFAVTESNRWDYAELLLMQVLNTNQRLVHPFFHNQVKRRIAMITSPQKTSHQYGRKLMVLPVTAFAVILFAFSYKENTIPDMKSQQNDKPFADTTGQPGKEKFIEVPIGPNSQIKRVPIVFKNKAENTVSNLENAMLIINGKQSFRSKLQNKLIESDSVVVYSPGDKEATRLYGTNARNGVIIFFNAKITDRPAPAPETGENSVFDKVEIEAAFPGGMDAWRRYLERNLNSMVPLLEKAPAGTYTVVIQFIVNLDGSISDTRALTHHGFGMEAEAIRAIEKGPKWLAAIQNGRQVRAYRKQPITFVVDNGPKKEGKVSAGDGKELNEVVVVGYTNPSDPVFPGGDSAWRQYLIANANSLVPVNKGAPPGKYKTKVRFIVHPDGSISDITALTSYGFGMEDEAIRLIKNSPRWIPAIREGTKVSSFKEQPVTFVIEEQTESSNIVPATPKISLNQLKSISVLDILGLPAGIEVISYNFTIDGENGSIIEIKNTGNTFNNATKIQLKGATPGKLMTFDFIRIRINGEEKKMASRVYKVVN